MLEKTKSYLKRYPWLRSVFRKLHHNLDFQRHIWADRRNNIIGDALREGTATHGFKLLVPNHPANLGMLKGTFEPEETAIVLQYLPQTDVFVDIGANIGLYSCMALQKGKYVIAIEPQARNLRCLYSNFITNGWADNVEVYPVGLGERPCIKLLYGASGTSASFIPQYGKYDSRFRQTIPITTLDALVVGRFPKKKLFIKIDVEGYEHNVLGGGLKTVGSTPRPNWLVEICLNEYHPSGLNPYYRATFELFWENGYQARTADSRGLVIRPADVDAWCRKGQCESGTINYVFTEHNVL